MHAGEYRGGVQADDAKSCGLWPGVRAHEDESDGDSSAFGAVSGALCEATWKREVCGCGTGWLPEHIHACSGRSNRGSTLYSTDLQAIKQP